MEWQLPLDGELYRVIPGPDRPDYSLLVLERPLHFYPGAGFDLARVEPEQRVEDRKGRQMVRVHALLVCARFVGQQLQPGMHDLAVNIAYVIDNSLARDAIVDFSKIEVAARGLISEGHLAEPRPARVRVPATTGEVLPRPRAAPQKRRGCCGPVWLLTGGTGSSGSPPRSSSGPICAWPACPATPTATLRCRRRRRSTGWTRCWPTSARCRGGAERRWARRRDWPGGPADRMRRFTVRVDGESVVVESAADPARNLARPPSLSHDRRASVGGSSGRADRPGGPGCLTAAPVEAVPDVRQGRPGPTLGPAAYCAS